MGNGVSKISCTHQRFTSSDKKYRRKIVIDKCSIGGPYEFQHLAHIGADGTSQNTSDNDHDGRPAPLASEVLRQQLAEITRALQELPTATHFQPHPAAMRRSCTAVGPLHGTMDGGRLRSVSRKPVAMPPRGIASCNDIYGPTVRKPITTRQNMPPANMPRHATVAHTGAVARPSLQRWASEEHEALAEKVQVEEDETDEEDGDEESELGDPAWIQPKPGMSNMKWLVESKIDAQLQKVNNPCDILLN
ncbi:hypothetical protein BCR43DRAFT_504333 [Syncephalastrum racemosum]|uniref:CRIB domain-containing protein n=1 Tax=Syncephalastrum racemosum TaxID=13706 RepID=A0A1X2HG09_SYNRA|nr:hypothetical protein BCR43DRAFT_504333 [Syncephalastrum racemosum]